VRLQLSGEAAPAWRDALIERGTTAVRLESDVSEMPGLRVEWLR